MAGWPPRVFLQYKLPYIKWFEIHWFILRGFCGGKYKKIIFVNKIIKIWKSLIVKQGNIDELTATLRKFEPYVDAFITDTFDPVSGASGATGIAHDWGISKKLVGVSKKPVVLAGGLNAENVFETIYEMMHKNNPKKFPELY